MYRSVAMVLFALVLTGASNSATQAPDLTVEEGRRLAEKLERIVAPEGHTPQTVVLHQREVNAYLRFQGADALPAGIDDPHLTFGDEGALFARAVVALDAVAQSQQGGFLNPLTYLSGNLEVVAHATLTTNRGHGQVEVESVSVGGVPMPRAVLNELVRHYTRSETDPNGIDLAEPFELPYEIQDVSVELYQAVVVQ